MPTLQQTIAFLRQQIENQKEQSTDAAEKEFLEEFLTSLANVTLQKTENILLAALVNLASEHVVEAHKDTDYKNRCTQLESALNLDDSAIKPTTATGPGLPSATPQGGLFDKVAVPARADSADVKPSGLSQIFKGKTPGQ